MANQIVTPMVDKAPPRRVGRTILAIAGGFLAVVLLSVDTDLVLHLLKVFPALGQRMSDNLFVWATFYRTIYGILGSYITARLAPYRPMWHAMVGAIIGMFIGTVGAVATWNKDLGPTGTPLHSCSPESPAPGSAAEFANPRFLTPKTDKCRFRRSSFDVHKEDGAARVNRAIPERHTGEKQCE